MLDPKIRIQLLNKEGAIIGDRLVAFASEVYTGPKEKHQGALKIEVDLHDKESVEKFKAYLDRLVGDLPIGVKKLKKIDEEVLGEHPVDDMIAKLTKCADQDKAIAYLKGLNYRFVDYQFIEELMDDKKLIFTPYHESHPTYQWLVLCTKQAKDPANDKYNFSLMVGIKIMGKTRDKILIYKEGVFDSTLPILPPAKSEFNMKEKKKLTVFPKYMTILERKQWRGFNNKFLAGKTLTGKQEQFYLRWKPEVEKMNKKAE